MNIAKNMEFIFLGAVALIGATGFATAAAQSKPPLQSPSSPRLMYRTCPW